MNFEFQIIGKRVAVARTRNNRRRIINNAVKIDESLQSVAGTTLELTKKSGAPLRAPPCFVISASSKQCCLIFEALPYWFYESSHMKPYMVGYGVDNLVCKSLESAYINNPHRKTKQASIVEIRHNMNVSHIEQLIFGPIIQIQPIPAISKIPYRQ